MSSPWTPERRARQAAAIQRWRPWERSTGPQSAEGKAVASKNAFRGGRRKALRKEMRGLRELFKAWSEVFN
jgi:hypothetical protein